MQRLHHTAGFRLGFTAHWGLGPYPAQHPQVFAIFKYMRVAMSSEALLWVPHREHGTDLLLTYSASSQIPQCYRMYQGPLEGPSQPSPGYPKPAGQAFGFIQHLLLRNWVTVTAGQDLHSLNSATVRTTWLTNLLEVSAEVSASGRQTRRWTNRAILISSSIWITRKKRRIDVYQGDMNKSHWKMEAFPACVIVFLNSSYVPKSLIRNVCTHVFRSCFQHSQIYTNTRNRRKRRKKLWWRVQPSSFCHLCQDPLLWQLRLCLTSLHR